MSENHGLDTDTHVYFYEQDYYVLSNFSSFQVYYEDKLFPTVEHAYHWSKFNYDGGDPVMLGNIRHQIRVARSAHDAFRIAHFKEHEPHVVPHWDTIKLDVMREILLKKVSQHEYVKKKLLNTGDRILVENSWRDPWWGSGPNNDGLNHLGKLWMEVRETIRQFEKEKTDN